jgi:hypothetical protein
MDTCDKTSAAGHVLAEHVAHEVFDALPERGVIVAIMAHDGTCWQSNSKEFAQLGLDETSITMAQLAAEHTNCGYVIIAVPRGVTQPLTSDATLLEALLGQISLIARLIERNKLARTQAGGFGITGMAECCLN